MGSPAIAFASLWAAVIIFFYLIINWTSQEDVMYSLGWIGVQWMPSSSPFRSVLQRGTFAYWRSRVETKGVPLLEHNFELKINEVDVSEAHVSLVGHLAIEFGSDWRRQPLLLRNLWTAEELQNPHRKLSLQGLLNEHELEIPYFVDARKPLLTPDGQAPVSHIVKNMTLGAPHKIGSQLLVQLQPELIAEVAPTDIVTNLFGNFFDADHVRGTGPSQRLPALTTVPVFMAHSNPGADNNISEQQQQTEKQNAFTSLHCEPIGNVAVQLMGSKRWTLVSPEFSHLLRPATSPDGRAFFASYLEEESLSSIPHYSVTTRAGDAIWVPTWTWHRVDYDTESDHESSDRGSISLGASLFHFRPIDFVRNNPLFAVLMVPAMVLEVLGIKTQ